MPAPRIRLTVGDLGSGEFRATAKLTGSDALPDDDTGFALLRRVVPKVLLVSAAPNADDAAYLGAALGALETPRLEVTRATAASLAGRPLAEYSAVLVSDAGVLDSAGESSLRRYVQQGGAAILTLGQRSQTLKVVPVSGQAITGSAVAGKVGEGDRIGELTQSHPVLRDTAGWRDIRFFRQVRVTTGNDDRVLLRLAGGPPLLIERAVGAGRVLLLTSPLDRDWNDLALHPLFVRFLGDATTWLAGIRIDAANAVVGGLLTASLGDRAGAQVFDPQGRRALTLDESAGNLRFSPDQAGFYEVRGGGRSDFIAVNVDARESDLSPLPPEAVERWKSLATPASASAPPPAFGCSRCGTRASVTGLVLVAPRRRAACICRAAGGELPPQGPAGETRMSALERFERYLDEARSLLRREALARAGAGVAIIAALVTVLAVGWLVSRGFPSQQVVLARVLLIVLVVATGAALFVPTWHRLRRDEGARELERRLPGQDGRIDTILDAQRRVRAGEPASVLTEFLAHDAERIAAQRPLDETLPATRRLIPAGIAAAALLGLVGLALFGPATWRAGTRHLWLGQSLPAPALAAARSLQVSPGNATVRRNQDLTVKAEIKERGLARRSCTCATATARGKRRRCARPPTAVSISRSTHCASRRSTTSPPVASPAITSNSRSSTCRRSPR